MIDLPLIHTIYTLLLFGIFIGICVWAFSKKRDSEFEEASRLPFDDEELATTDSRKKQ